MLVYSTGAKLSRDGFIANGIDLVMKKWNKSRDELALIFKDSSTVFAHVEALINARDTEQCRNQLKIGPNVDLAVICVVTATNTYATKGNHFTAWTCSDLKENSIRISIYGILNEELVTVGHGSVVAVLNPDLTDYAKDHYRAISVKQCDNVMLIGVVDGLQMCKGVTVNRTKCKNLVYKHKQGEFCKYHIKSAFVKPKDDQKKISPRAGEIANQVNGAIAKIEIQDNEKQPFIFKDTSPTDPGKVMAKLGDLGELLNKVNEMRTGTIINSITKKQTASNDNSMQVDDKKKFDSAVQNLKNVITPNHANNKQVLGLLQHISKHISRIDKEHIKKSGIMKMCANLLDHPMETIAIESLKLIRKLKRPDRQIKKFCSKPTYIFEPRKQTKKDVVITQVNSQDVEAILSASSDVNSYVEMVRLSFHLQKLSLKQEDFEETKKKLETLERMDKAQEYQMTVTEIDVIATYCEDCKKWTEKTSPYCQQESHTYSKKKCKKAYHVCLEAGCGYRYYSLNGQKPPWCPG
uniref:Zinc finger Mcm10/DnaG-type domain-containing protein n=1 Tax=Babesia bovis TaxID=5865 RepID=A7ATN5_BABBO|eukprot:XP_001609864.1 hypothetical protein [Babesia bovis T2Bo]